MRKFFGLATAFLLLLALPAAAQETTGSITGTVVDGSGSALPGVTVVVTADGKATTVYTDGKGKFRFPALIPGDYELVTSLTDFTSQKVTGLELRLGDVLTIDLTMELAEVSETIVVTSEAPVIEITRSASAASVSGELIDSLPRGRSFTSVVTQAAHAVDDDFVGGIGIDGASGSENRFIIDGMDTTDLQTGESAKNIITDHVQEVQIKSSGYAAEHGGATGGVINVITKTGSNDWRGDVTAYYSSSDLNGDHRPTLDRAGGEAIYRNFTTDDWDRVEAGFTLGGPVLKDRMWFFASYIPEDESFTRTLVYPDTTLVYPQDETFDYGTANLSGTIGNSVSYKVGANFSDRDRDNTVPGQLATGTAAQHPVSDFDVDRKEPNRSYSGNLDWLATQSLALSFRGGNFEYDTRDTGTNTDLWYNMWGDGGNCELYPEDVPPELCRQLFFGTAGNTGTAFDKFTRDTLEGDLTYYVSDFGGDHTFKTGVQLAQIGNVTLRGYQNTRQIFYWGSSVPDLFGVSRSGEYGVLRLLQIATQGDVSSDQVGLYLQDSWRPTDRLTLNLGLRVESEEVPSYAGDPGIPENAIDLDFGDKIAPRLGFAYDLLGDGQWKLYGSYGVFYDITKLEMPRGSFGGDKWVDWWFGIDNADWTVYTEDPNCRIGPSNNQDPGEAPQCAGEFFFSNNRRLPSNDPSHLRIDPDLQPMESNEITLGVEHQLGQRTSVGFRYVHKELKRTIEDVGVIVPGVGEQFFIANPGEGIATDILGPGFPNQPKAVRDYDGFEIDFRMRATKSWTVHASYLYSRLYGNYSGLASSDEFGRNAPNVNRFFDGLPMNFDASGSGEPVYGRLGTDRPHQFKAQVIYRTPWETSIGLNQFLSSGIPVSTQFTAPPNLPFFAFGRGDMGRTPTFTQTDLYIEHPIKIGDRFEIDLAVNVINLFDEDTVLRVDNTPALEDLPLSNEEFFAGFDPWQVVADEGVALDPQFGLARDWQARRQVRLSVRLRF